MLLERLLSSLSLTLSHAPPGRLTLPWDVFEELFVFLSMLLDGQMSEAAGFGAPHEERTLLALCCLKSLLLSTNERLAQFLIDYCNHFQYSMVVFSFIPPFF